MSLKSIIRSVTPRPALSAYHFAASGLIALWYGLPARRLVVVGVTGTKGKTSTCAMIHHILLQQGIKAGLISTAEIAVGSERQLNALKMTTPGRATLQRLLRFMMRAGCSHVVLETSSEALAQWRHLGIPYAVAVFTNLQPEHIEAHGSLRAYRAAKGRLFKSLHGRGQAVVNLDDQAADFFLSFSAAHKLGYSLTNKPRGQANTVIAAQQVVVNERDVSFAVNGINVSLHVGGIFNIENALAALGAAAALGITIKDAAQALGTFAGSPGRMEFIESGQPFRVVVDYAHTTGSLEAVYVALAAHGQLIAVLGSCGGGRDKSKREPLGRLAGRYARAVVVTDEDPYDEDPISIMKSVADGARSAGKRDGDNLWVINDRREAIRHALKIASAQDIVVITGKGAEQWLMKESGKKIPWDDRQIVREELLALAH